MKRRRVLNSIIFPAFGLSLVALTFSFLGYLWVARLLLIPIVCLVILFMVKFRSYKATDKGMEV